MMRLLLGVVSLVMLFTTLGAPPAAAQNPRSKGMWVSAGAGYGLGRPRCHECPDYDRESGLTGILRIGGKVTRKALLGVDLIGWTKSDGGARSTLGTATISALFYPRRTSGLFIKAGLGFSFLSLKNGSDITGMGGALTAGLGYDVPLGANLSVTPVADFTFGDIGDAQVGGLDTFSGWRQSVLQLGLTVTYH